MSDVIQGGPRCFFVSWFWPDVKSVWIWRDRTSNEKAQNWVPYLLKRFCFNPKRKCNFCWFVSCDFVFTTRSNAFTNKHCIWQLMAEDCMCHVDSGLFWRASSAVIVIPIISTNDWLGIPRNAHARFLCISVWRKHFDMVTCGWPKCEMFKL